MSDFQQLPQTTLFKNVFSGDKFKLFSQHLNAPFVGGFSHMLDFELFQRGHKKLSGLLLGIETVTEWICAHLDTQPTDLQMEEIPSPCSGLAPGGLKLQEAEFRGLKLSESL